MKKEGILELSHEGIAIDTAYHQKILIFRYLQTARIFRNRHGAYPSVKE